MIRKRRERGEVKTSCVFPPIPVREFDWCAYHDGDEETGRYGWGYTEKEAVADLARLDEERDEADYEAAHEYEYEDRLDNDRSR